MQYVFVKRSEGYENHNKGSGGKGKGENQFQTFSFHDSALHIIFQ